MRILVSLADKLHNARAILRDFRDASATSCGTRFSVKDPQQHLWYYRSLLDVYAQRIDNWMVDELREVIDSAGRRDPPIGFTADRRPVIWVGMVQVGFALPRPLMALTRLAGVAPRGQ